ncbi:MAG: hypothetical protein H6656_20005 [Ardenticatenaceae bacterium]|nr:hypothetical protein [Ardenticatenaceae bacterium]
MTSKTIGQKEIQERLASYLEPRFLYSIRAKIETLLVTAVLGGPLILLFAYMGRAGRTTLWPLFAVLGSMICWALFIGIAHRSISEETFLALSSDERMHRLFYESFWWRLYQGGSAIIISAVIVWGVAEIMIRFEFTSLLLFFLGAYFLFLLFCLIKHRWIAKIFAEGNEKHKWLKPLITITFGIAGIMPILGGIARTFQVSMGIEATQQLFAPILTASMLLLASTILILGVLAFLIAHAQYQSWKQGRIDIFTP